MATPFIHEFWPESLRSFWNPLQSTHCESSLLKHPMVSAATVRIGTPRSLRWPLIWPLCWYHPVCCECSSSSEMHLKWKPISLYCSRPWHFPRPSPEPLWWPRRPCMTRLSRVPESPPPGSSPRGALLPPGAPCCLGKPAAFKLNAFYPRAPWLEGSSASDDHRIHFLLPLHLLHSAISMRAMLRVLLMIHTHVPLLLCPPPF